MAEQPEMPEMPKMSPKMFIAPLGMLTIKFFKIDVTMYLQELRVAAAALDSAGWEHRPPWQALAEGARPLPPREAEPGLAPVDYTLITSNYKLITS